MEGAVVTLMPSPLGTRSRSCDRCRPSLGIDALGRDRALRDEPFAVDGTEFVEVSTPVIETVRGEHRAVRPHLRARLRLEIDPDGARVVAKRRLHAGAPLG